MCILNKKLKACLCFILIGDKIIKLGQTNKIISFSGQFPKNLMRQGDTFFFVVIISVGSNAVEAYTGNNHACLRHKCFTDNDRDQQSYGSDRSGPEQISEMTGNGHKFVFPM